MIPDAESAASYLRVGDVSIPRLRELQGVIRIRRRRPWGWHFQTETAILRVRAPKEHRAASAIDVIVKANPRDLTNGASFPSMVSGDGRRGH
jgi:hypothetical protein